jgi:hypothetical protein
VHRKSLRVPKKVGIPLISQEILTSKEERGFMELFSWLGSRVE